VGESVATVLPAREIVRAAQGVGKRAPPALEGSIQNTRRHEVPFCRQHGHRGDRSENLFDVLSTRRRD
jgi:hypothetical protein